MKKYRDSLKQYGCCFLLGSFFMITEACGEFILPFLNANMIDREGSGRRYFLIF